MNHLVLAFLFPVLILVSIALAHDKPDSHLLPRPLIITYPDEIQLGPEKDDGELQLKCSSWRVAGEANNLSPWKTVPSECAQYVKDYMVGRAYTLDLEMVSREAADFAKTFQLGGDGNHVWVFDVDETLLSNLPYYAQHDYGLQVFDSIEFDKWVAKAVAPAMPSSLKLYQQILELGFKVFLLTGRSERHRNVTVENLKNAGFQNWDKLILRGLEDHGKTATKYKSDKRKEMVGEGYRIVGNSGDQWSDLQGDFLASRSFKLPNPMYFIS